MKKKTQAASVSGAVPEELTEDMMPEQSTAKRILNTIVNVVLVLALLVAAVCTYTSYVSTSGNGVPSILGIRMFSIQTESMYPTLSPGDLIFDTGIKDTSNLQIGDIVTYWTVIDGERVLNTHRITQIYDGGNYLIFETKGDNNTITDALTVHESEIVGQYSGHKVAGLGKFMDYLQTSTGFLVVIVIPVAIFFLYHLIQFFRVLFEYNNVKNKLRYEMERGKTEDMLEDEKRKLTATRQAERERLERELRDKLREELLASGVTGQAPPAAQTAEEKPAESREEMESRIRAEMEAEARAKAAAEARASMEAEIRAKIKAELEAAASDAPAKA